MNLKPILVQHNKHILSIDKRLAAPMKTITIGFKLHSTKDRITVAEGFYTERDKYGYISVIPNYKTLSTSNLPNNTRICKFTVKDTMLVRNEISKDKAVNKKGTNIDHVGFFLCEEKKYFIFAFKFIPKEFKYSEIMLVPKFNLISMKIL